jgi:hypothetical protein
MLLRGDCLTPDSLRYVLIAFWVPAIQFMMLALLITKLVWIIR